MAQPRTTKSRSARALPPLVRPRATKPLRLVLETIAREFECFAEDDIDTQAAERLRILIAQYDQATGAKPTRPFLRAS